MCLYSETAPLGALLEGGGLGLAGVDLREREAGGLEDFSDWIDGEPQSLKGMGSEERQAVVPAEEDKREGGEVAVADLDPCRGLFPSGAVGQDHGDLPIWGDSEAGQERRRELAERGSGVHQAFDGNQRLIAGSGWTNMNLD